MRDLGHDWTDQRISELEAKMHDMYVQAANEMQDKLDSWLKEYERQKAGWKKAVKTGVKTKAEFDKWLSDRAMERTWQQGMIETLANDALHADVRARQLINDELPTIIAENANMAGYMVDRMSGLDTTFTLYNQDAVRFLLDEPMVYRTVDESKDLDWNRRKFSSALTQSILQGESIPNVAKRLAGVFAMDERAATLAARTSVTYAESMGKRLSYDRAYEIGIPLKQEWRANMDGRTRLSHRQADGQVVKVGELFNVGGNLMTGPGDPSAPGEEIYNCFIGETSACCDSKIVRSYRHSFTGKFITINTSSGIEFTCTPNHPILTPNGWVSAELLNEGDYLLIARVLNGGHCGRNPDVNHVMPSMETIHEFLSMFSVERTGTLCVNFHGDVPTSDVEIVGKKRLLGVNGDSSGADGVNELLFEYADSPISDHSSLVKRLNGIVTTSSGVLSCESVSLSLLGSHSGHPNLQRLGSSPSLDTTLTQNAIDNISAMPNISSKLLDGITGKVALDQIINVKVTYGTRHVYNLQTENGYYFVGNPDTGNVIIAHNCRCRIQPVIDLDGLPEAVVNRYSRLPDGVTYEDWKSGVFRTHPDNTETESSKRERGVD